MNDRRFGDLARVLGARPCRRTVLPEAAPAATTDGTGTAGGDTT